METYESDYFVVFCSVNNLNGNNCDEINEFFSEHVSLPFDSSVYYFNYDTLIAGLSKGENVTELADFMQKYRIKTMPAILHKYANKNIEQFNWDEKNFFAELHLWIQKQSKIK